MKKLLTVILTAIALAVGAACVVIMEEVLAQESVTLNTPIVKTATSSCALDYMNLDVGNSRILVALKCNNGDVITKVYDSTTTPTGASLLSALNTSNNSGANPSLIRRVYSRLIADNVIVGTVSGTPQ